MIPKPPQIQIYHNDISFISFVKPFLWTPLDKNLEKNLLCFPHLSDRFLADATIDPFNNGTVP
jgi:hypothetical protein